MVPASFTGRGNQVAKQKERYKAWGKAYTSAWVSGDVEAMMDCWAQDCIHIAFDPFGDHRITQGREALRELYADKAANRSNKKLIEHEVLSANKERGIFHTWVSWTTKDGEEWACTHINIVHLDENDRCAKYTEWNVAWAKEEQTESPD